MDATAAAETTASVAGEIDRPALAPDGAGQASQGSTTPDRRNDRPVRRRLSPPNRVDLLVCAGYLLCSSYLFIRLLVDIPGRYLVAGASDQMLFEWFFSTTARSIANGHNPLDIDFGNVPNGINGMGNTTVLGISVPLTPVTLLFGPSVSYVLALIFGVAATAAAWYWLFSRHLTGSRAVAAVAGALCAFSPAMVSQANGHMQIAVHFAIPLIFGLVLRIGTSDRPLRLAVPLGLLGAYQVLIGEEMLLIAAAGFAVFLAVCVAQRPALIRERLRSTLAGVGTGVGIALALVAYPLWYQFAGPQHYDGLPFTHGLFNDVLSFAIFPSRSLFGDPDQVGAYTLKNQTEENAFFGIPLLLLASIIVVWLWRSVPARAAAVTAAVFAYCSLGDHVIVRHHHTDVPAPGRILNEMPLVSDIITSRFAFVVTPMLAILIVLAAERIRRPVEAGEAAETTTAASGGSPRRLVPRIAGSRLRLLGTAALVFALVPIVPTPLRAADRDPLPRFFTSGTWRKHIPADSVVVSVPLPFYLRSWGMEWQVASDMEFRIVGGYFVGPHPAGPLGPEGHGGYGAPTRDTDKLLFDVFQTGKVPRIGQAEQARAKEDLAYWQADVLLLAPGLVDHPNELRAAVDALVGPGTLVDDVWVWRVD